MKTQIINIILLLLFFAAICCAQSSTKADKVYNQLGYIEAIQMYRNGDLTMESMEKIAHGYRLNHDTQNAEKWYAQIAEESSDPINVLYYAQALHSNGNLEKAKIYYEKYDAASGGGSDMRGRQLANAIDRISSFKDNDKIEVNLAKNINSPKLDFSATYFRDGVVFVSNRPPSAMKKGFSEKDSWTGDDYNAHYFAKENAEGIPVDPQPFSLNLNEKFHEGPLTFSKSGDQVFFTRNISKKSKNKEFSLKIFTAFQSGEEFAGAERLDFGDENSNDAHPALSPDGLKLYFASDREGGYGGMDIWVTTFAGGEWTSPENLGPKINTPGNELFPFVYDDGTLYFASDGWGGLGGLDNFYADKIDDFNWGDAENLGTPFNSNKDDFSYILNGLGTEGYFTSAREGGMGKDDIYHFKLPEPQGNKKKENKVFAQICVFDESNNSRLSGAKVNVLVEAADGSFQGFQDDFVVKLTPTGEKDEFVISLKRRDPFGDSGTGNETYTTNGDGYFDLEVKPGRKYVFISKLQGYGEARQEFSSEDLINSGGEFCIPMSPTECLSIYGKTLNRRHKDKGKVVPNATVELLDLCTGETKTVLSDKEGFYEFPCVSCDCEFIVKGEKATFKDDAQLSDTSNKNCGAGEAVELNLELMPGFDENGNAFVNFEEGIYIPEKDRVNKKPGNNGGTPGDGGLEGTEIDIEFDIDDIYYDFDEDYIRSWDAVPDMNNLVRIMRKYPEFHVELGSHTDSRGTNEYNDDLSARRAKSALEYLVQNGIEIHRITARGYGENVLINECDDNTKCTEAEHQMNRRTEVRIYKK